MLILCSFYEIMLYCKIVSSKTKKRFHKTWSEIVHYHFEEAYFCGLLGGHMLISEIQQRILSLIFVVSKKSVNNLCSLHVYSKLRLRSISPLLASTPSRLKIWNINCFAFFQIQQPVVK